jgi:hypothetical protein
MWTGLCNAAKKIRLMAPCMVNGTSNPWFTGGFHTDWGGGRWMAPRCRLPFGCDCCSFDGFVEVTNWGLLRFRQEWNSTAAPRYWEHLGHEVSR